MKLSPDEPATTNRQMADQSSKYNVSAKSYKYLYVGTLYLAIKRTLHFGVRRVLNFGGVRMTAPVNFKNFKKSFLPRNFPFN